MSHVPNYSSEIVIIAISLTVGDGSSPSFWPLLCRPKEHAVVLANLDEGGDGGGAGGGQCGHGVSAAAERLESKDVILVVADAEHAARQVGHRGGPQGALFEDE